MTPELPAGPARPRFDWGRLRRNPRVAVGLGALAAALLLWPFAGFSWIPWLVGLGVLVVLRLLRLDGLLRGWDVPLAAVAVVVGLMMSSGVWSWALAGSLGVLLAGLVRLPRWRVVAVGAVLCVASGVGFGFSAARERAEADQVQRQAGDTARAVIAERADAVLPAFLKSLASPVPDPQPICRLLSGEAEAVLTASVQKPGTGTPPMTCEDAVAVLHSAVPHGGKVPTADKLPALVADGPGMLANGCATDWAKAAGAALGTLELRPVDVAQRTYEVAGFRRC